MDPAAQVHFIHRDRLVERIAAVPFGDPGAVGPGVMADRFHDRAVIGSHLVAKAVGIRFLVAVAVLGPNLIFVDLAGFEPRDEQLPAAP